MSTISLLNDMCMGMREHLELITSPPVGPSHCPVITCTAILADSEGGNPIATATASAGNTKLARKRAAEELLKHPEVASKVQKFAQERENGKPITKTEGMPCLNYKGRLQEVLAKASASAAMLPGFKRGMFMPIYITSSCDGPPHAPHFKIQVVVDLLTDKVVCEGSGSKKRDAEQAAARAMLETPQMQPYIFVQSMLSAPQQACVPLSL